MSSSEAVIGVQGPFTLLDGEVVTGRELVGALLSVGVPAHVYPHPFFKVHPRLVLCERECGSRSHRSVSLRRAWSSLNKETRDTLWTRLSPNKQLQTQFELGLQGLSVPVGSKFKLGRGAVVTGAQLASSLTALGYAVELGAVTSPNLALDRDEFWMLQPLSLLHGSLSTLCQNQRGNRQNHSGALVRGASGPTAHSAEGTRDAPLCYILS